MSYFDRGDAIRAIGAYDTWHAGARPEPRKVTEYYGEDVFSLAVMKEFLSRDTYRKLKSTVRRGAPLDPDIADEVATAMKHWALDKGATHYTHWFQPLTGSTAEKHDAFAEPDGNGGVMMSFSGKNLVIGESDASSFPSGGLRSTFEARGYTAWDPTSPAFIRRGVNGATLCIPTAFCSYTGEALDKKTPLLRSVKAVGEQVARLLRCFGETETATPEVTLGAEQEYFLVDKRLALARPDLIQTGRTLFGAPPPKHQQLDDHYYGAIKPRVLAFMTEVDEELWKLGIPAKTRHNEVAPAQFEIASVFEELNLAVDHNMMTMEILRQVADRHGFICLLHEKPFAGVNGSGKHNNWSLGTANGVNLLNPGNDPHRSALFLTTLCAVITAVDRHGDLLRAATASAGNSHRLGANEAPPAILSIFLGDQLTEVIDALEKGTAEPARKGRVMKVGVDTLPPLPLDATDRNRTSPFAYTGNKFEFRAPGSGQSCSGPNTILNTVVAEALDEIVTELEKTPREKFNTALQKILQKLVKQHRRVIFNGDNYSAEWLAEAEKRGLPNLPSVPEALAAYIKEDNIRLFEKYGVFSRAEAHARYEVYLSDYKARFRIEGELSVLLARTSIFPAVSEQLGALAADVASLKAAGIESGAEAVAERAVMIGKLLRSMDRKTAKLDKLVSIGDTELMIAAQNDLRIDVDALERVCDDKLWPLPKYREMLFIY